MPFLTSKDVCALLRISSMTLIRMVRDGRLPKPVKFGTSRSAAVRFDPEKIREYIERQTAA